MTQEEAERAWIDYLTHSAITDYKAALRAEIESIDKWPTHGEFIKNRILRLLNTVKPLKQ